jgi:hypothetical protein
MMKMTKWLLMTSIVMMLLVVATVLISNKPGEHYCVVVYKSGEGWGYNVLFKNRIVINQPFIPVIQGNHPFRNKNTAMKTGKLVVKKLSSGKSPEISHTELFDLDAIP